MRGWRLLGWRGEDGGEELKRGGMASEVHVEERSGDFESDVFCDVWVEGRLEGSRNESLRPEEGVEDWNIFHCHVKVGTFDLTSKECAEEMFHDPEVFLIPVERYLQVGSPFIPSLPSADTTPQHFWSIPHVQFSAAEELSSFPENSGKGNKSHPPPARHHSDFIHHTE